MRIIQQWSDIFHDSKLILDISGVANQYFTFRSKYINKYTAKTTRLHPS